jgi:hypothetical protein
LYAFLLEGGARVAGESLGSRDAIGVWDVEELEFEILENSRILLMEVPMSN